VAVVARGADILVIARGIIQVVNAALTGVAQVGRADVIIRTVKRCLEGTYAIDARVSDGAFIAVAALSVKVLMSTLAVLAEVECAGVVVIAVEPGAADALPVDALVVDGAGVSVGATPGQGHMCASVLGIATVFGAWIAVIAILHPRGDAPSGLAGISGRARVAVIALAAVGG